MTDLKEWFVRTEEGSVYGPAAMSALSEWAKEGRIEPSCFVSSDRINWKPAQLVPELEMKWLVETEPGKFFGPFHRQVVSRLFHDGQLSEKAKAYRLHEFAIDEDPPPVEKIVEIEKVVEKVVEVERIVKVEPPPRTELVVPEVVEPTGSVPPSRVSGSLFGGLDHDRLVVLEAAAQRELAQGKRFGFSSNLFGRKSG